MRSYHVSSKICKSNGCLFCDSEVMLKTSSHDRLLKEDVFFQSAIEQQNSLTAHINYGYISSTNSLLLSPLDDCRYASALPHPCHDTAQQHVVAHSNATAKGIGCSLNTRKRKRNRSSESFKRPRSLYDQISTERDQDNDELLKQSLFNGSLYELHVPFHQTYWTDDELKAFEAEEYVTESEENEVAQPIDTKQKRHYHHQFDVGLETRLGENLKAFQRYIETCVKPTELIVFFDKFSFEQRKLLHQTMPKNTIKANRQIFDIINSMKDTPDKYTSLLRACKEGDYPKVTEILLGRLVPKDRKHRRAISKASKHIYQRLSVCDVTPHLLKKGVINRLDFEEVNATEARCEAALKLLLLLPNRSRQWFGFFIEALVESNQSELAELIDKKRTKEAENNNVNTVMEPNEIQEGAYSRTLHKTSLESVSQSTSQLPSIRPVLVYSTNDPIFVNDYTQMETLLKESENVAGILQDCDSNNSDIFGRLRKSFKRKFNSVIGKRSIYSINE